jgi:hypothetical protein
MGLHFYKRPFVDVAHFPTIIRMTFSRIMGHDVLCLLTIHKAGLIIANS